MHSKSSLATAAAFLLPFAAAQLEGSTIMDPAIPYDQIDSILPEHLAPAGHTITAWADASVIPENCKSGIEGEEGLSAVDSEVFDVKYDDCDTPWIMCRHTAAGTTIEQMAETFGRLPVKSRSYVRHLTAVPGAASAGSNNNDIVFRDDTARISVYMHETAHSMDSTAFDGFTSFSTQSIWTDAYEADGKRVASDYSRSSQAENLAQMIVVATFDQNVPDGIQTIAPNWQDNANQLRAVNDNIGDELKAGGTCGQRLEQSAPVAKDGAATSRLMRFVKNTPLPDVSLAAGIKRMEGGVFHYEDKF